MTGVASLIEANRDRLTEILGPAPFAVVGVDEGHCRVRTDGLTIHFYWQPALGVIHSSIELASVPPHAVPFTNHLHTLLVLRSRGEEWPTLHPEEFTAVPIEAEMKRVSRALDIARD